MWAQEIIGAPGATSGANGSVVTITGGAGNGTGNGGFVNITSGAAGAAGEVGEIQIATPDVPVGTGLSNLGINITGGVGDLRGGAIQLTTGVGRNDISGAITLQGASGDNAGGAIELNAGLGTSGGAGGGIQIMGGNAAGGTPGVVTIQAGASTGVPSANIQMKGHTQQTQLAGTLALSSCGTGSPALSGNATDMGGTVTVGGGTVTACTLTFGDHFSGLGAGPVPYCVANNFGSTPIAVSISAISTTAVTFTFASDLNGAGGKFHYICGY
jgi:hypothetical protein